jgi:hypothetical protein
MCSQLFHEMVGILWKSDANPLAIHGQRPTRSLDALDYIARNVRFNPNNLIFRNYVYDKLNLK